MISEDALSVMVPVLEELMEYGPVQIRRLFEKYGVLIQEWDRARTDWLTIGSGVAARHLSVSVSDSTAPALPSDAVESATAG